MSKQQRPSMHGLHQTECPRLTRHTRWRRRPAPDTLWPPHKRSDSLSRARRPSLHRAGLPSEPSRGFFRIPRSSRSWRFFRRNCHTSSRSSIVRPSSRWALVPVRLANPIADRLCGALEIASYLPGRAQRIFSVLMAPHPTHARGNHLCHPEQRAYPESSDGASEGKGVPDSPRGPDESWASEALQSVSEAATAGLIRPRSGLTLT